MSEAAPAQRRLGPILLAPGVAPYQVPIYLVVVWICAFASAFVSLMQPLVFVELLHMGPGRQGLLAGTLGTVQQLGTLLFLAWAGSLADIVGRRALLVITLLGFAACMIVYPLITAVWALFALRFVWGVAFTGYTAGGATKAMDYPDNNSRGKFISLVLVSSSVAGSLFMWGVSRRLPGWMRDLGLNPHGVAMGSFWIMAAVTLAGAAVAFFFMTKDGRKSHATSAEPQPSLLENVKGVLAHARDNPRFALILLVGAVVRTDSVILASFLSLWVVSAGRTAGIDVIEATKTAGLLTAVLTFSQFLSMPLFGWLADRTNRVVLLLFSLVGTAAAFSAFSLVPDVFGPWMVVCVLLIGLAEGAQSVSSQSLIAQEAPAHLRGSSMGVFASLGTISLMIVSSLGGYLFDQVGYSAPFLMEGVLHMTFLAAALCLLLFQRRRHTARPAIG